MKRYEIQYEIRPKRAMDRSNPRRRALWWIAAVELMLTFALADFAAIAWSADWVSGGQLIACAMAYLLIAFGVLFTAYKMGPPAVPLVPVATQMPAPSKEVDPTSGNVRLEAILAPRADRR